MDFILYGKETKNLNKLFLRMTDFATRIMDENTALTKSIIDQARVCPSHPGI